MVIQQKIQDSMLKQELVCSGYITICPEPCGLLAARQKIYQLASSLEMSKNDTEDLLLAVGEAVSNAYLYGTPDISRNLIYLGWRFADDTLTVTIKDEGMGFDPNSEKRHPSRGSGKGYGIGLMRASMDNVIFEYDAGAKVTLVKHISKIK